MARVANVNIPNQKRIVISLTYIHGIGLTTSKSILDKAGIDHTIRTKDLSEPDLDKIREQINGLITEGDLRREVLTNIRRLRDVRSYRGDRHKKGLPVRGQRSKTNNRTVRGNSRRTMGTGRVKQGQKT
jgi:small subunit ribosomal protein S13